MVITREATIQYPWDYYEHLIDSETGSYSTKESKLQWDERGTLECGMEIGKIPRQEGIQKMLIWRC